MNLTAQANRTLALRDSAHIAQDALIAVMTSLVSANGTPSGDVISDFEFASAALICAMRGE